MRKKRLVSVGFLALFLLATWSAAQSAAGNAGIEIQVSSKGKPVAGARVLLRYREAPTGAFAALTDSKGRAAFVNLAPGAWNVEVSHEEYLSYVAAVTLIPGKKPSETTSFLQATGAGRQSIRIKYFKASGPLGTPVEAPAPPPRIEPDPIPAPPEPEPPAPEPEPVELREPDIPAPTPEPEAAPEIVPEPEPPAPEPPPASPPVELREPDIPAPAPEPEPVPEPAMEPELPDTPVVEAPETPEPEAPEQVAPPEPTVEPAKPEPEEIAPPAPVAPPEPEPEPEPMVAPAAVEPSSAPVSEPEIEAPPMPEPVAAEPEVAPEREPAPAPEPPTPEPEPMEPAPPAIEPEPMPEPEIEAPAPPAVEVEPMEDVAPAPAPEPPALEPPVQLAAAPAPEPAEPTAEPEPEAAPAPVPAPAPRVPSPSLRAFRDRTCPECKPGEWSAASVELADAARSGTACPSDAVEGAKRAAHLIARAPVGSLRGFAGPAIGGVSPTALELISGDARGSIGDALDWTHSSCRVLAVSIPRGAKFTGFRYEAADDRGQADCLGEEDCPIGESRFLGNPGIERGQEVTVVYSVFENSSVERQRRARLTAYFVPESGWQP